MICLIAMVVFAFLGIFSASHRELAWEAFDCVFRKTTFRPCNTGFDQKMKGKIVGKILARSPRAAGFVHKRFELISWFFTLLMLASFAYSAYSVYNLVVFGTCDPAHPENCVFTQGADPNRVVCPYDAANAAQAVDSIGNFKKVADFNAAGKPQVYFFGTSWCPHCAWEKPVFIRATSRFGNWSGLETNDSTQYRFASPYMDVHVFTMDKTNLTSTEEAIFTHFSAEGHIPLVLFNGKYYRVGSGEGLGEANDELTLTALMCEVTSSPIADCQSSQVQEALKLV